MQDATYGFGALALRTPKAWRLRTTHNILSFNKLRRGINMRISYERVNLFILATLMVITAGSIFLSADSSPTGSSADWWSGLWQNFSSEMLGALLMFLLLNIWLRGREKKDQKIQNQKHYKSLLFHAKDYEEVQHILQEMQDSDALEDVHLPNVDLSKIGLYQADFTGANLRGAIFHKTNLVQSILNHVDLTDASMEDVALSYATLENARLCSAKLNRAALDHAILRGAHLESADLSFANLQFADFEHARLSGANLAKARIESANFASANLRDVSLRNAVLVEVQMDYNTILPDGTQWSGDPDLRRFTNPNHPHFWEPHWANQRPASVVH